MQTGAAVSVPALVRLKPGALFRAGVYLRRLGLEQVALFRSDGLPLEIDAEVDAGLDAERIVRVLDQRVREASVEAAVAVLGEVPARCQAIVGLGGGKALDAAKYVAHLARRPFVSLPTSLSNDGFASPGASLLLGGRRRSLPASVPAAVIVDPDVCVRAPLPLWCSGVGELVSKITAVADWKIAFHTRGTPVNDYAALLAETSVHPFLTHPRPDREGARLLASGLMLSCLAMAVAGSSRPASGSEHLVSHALDAQARRPRLHGLQVGLAAYVVAHLQGITRERVWQALEVSGFFEALREDPLDREDFLAAFERAPQMKQDYATVLTSRDCLPEIRALVHEDPVLRQCLK